MTVTVTPASSDDLGYAKRLLNAAGFPTADIEADGVQMFLATVAGDPVGVGGLELYRRNGLLRSVVVNARDRGQGYGREICTQLEARAREAGMERLFLLTTDAMEYFSRLGYGTIEREAVPAAIGSTSQFADLCPESAILMEKRL